MDASILKGKVADEPRSNYSHQRNQQQTFAQGEDQESRNIRSRAKRMASILEDSGQPFSVPASEAELRQLEMKAASIRLSDIATVMQRLRKARYAELCFVIDASSSMDPYIKQVKAVIGQVIDALKKPAIACKPDTSIVSSVRVACIGYRDHCDSTRFETCDFTGNLLTFRGFLDNLKAIGGGDIPEDVLGGLNLVKSLKWSKDAGVKQIFHMGDAPAHGKRFQGTEMEDEYPHGHPEDPLVEEIFQWFNEMQIFYVFGKINHHTDRMIEVFSEVAGKHLDIFDIQNPKDITAAIIDSVSKSTDTVVSQSKLSQLSSSLSKLSLTNVYETRKYTIEKKMPDWNSVPEIEGRLQSYELPKSINDVVEDIALDKRSPKKVLMKLAPHPFSEGTERIAYYGLDVTLDETVPAVLKEYKRVGKNPSTAANRYELMCQMQTIASFMAFEFTDLLKKMTNCSLDMRFLKVMMFATENKGAYRFMTLERKYTNDAMFIRFSNNAGYVMLEENARKCGLDPTYISLVMAFSHWTYVVTKGKLMIVDLEGVVSKSGDVKQVELTDPAIHCTDLTRYGGLNLGIDGMVKFFETHDCNEFCTALKLKPSNDCQKDCLQALNDIQSLASR